MLHLFENDQEEEKQSEGKIVGDGKDDASTIDSSDLYSALNARKREFARGIGKVSQIVATPTECNVNYLSGCVGKDLCAR